MTRILVIDDEPQIRRFLDISLTSQGYEVVSANSGQGGLEMAALESPDLIVLDLGLPDIDGQQVLVNLREFFNGPIIVLSVRDSEREKVSALDNGCNDFVTKPFGVKELLARIRAVLRSSMQTDAPVTCYDDGHLRIEFIERRVWLDGKLIHFSRKEFALLKILSSNAGRILTHQYLLREIWGPHFKESTHYLRILIGRLRAKLRDVPTNPHYIETENAIGYRFTDADNSVGSE